jgi:hypothetical protein
MLMYFRSYNNQLNNEYHYIRFETILDNRNSYPLLRCTVQCILVIRPGTDPKVIQRSTCYAAEDHDLNNRVWNHLQVPHLLLFLT